jgi:hypothetical protein
MAVATAGAPTPNLISSSHSLQMFFHPIRRHALNPPQKIPNNVNHPWKLNYLYQKFNFMAIF